MENIAHKKLWAVCMVQTQLRDGSSLTAFITNFHEKNDLTRLIIGDKSSKQILKYWI